MTGFAGRAGMGVFMKFIAGIDGGGTKTIVICSDLNGKILKEHKFGPFNVNSIGKEGFAALMEEICAFLQEMGQCAALCIGAAGCSNPSMQEVVKAAMERAGIANWKLVGDHEIALSGALEGKPGICLGVGTGTFCFGKNDNGESLRTGGWGHLIGDEGSGYALGRDALSAVTRHWDGYGEATSLTRAVKEEMKLDTHEKLVAYVYGNDKSAVAAFSRIVEREAKAGDAVANAILRNNAKALARQAAATAKHLQMERGEAVLLGGLVESDTVYRSFLQEAMMEFMPDFLCIVPKQTAAVGAVIMAGQQL